MEILDIFSDMSWWVLLLLGYPFWIILNLITLKLGLVLPSTMMDLEELPALIAELEAQPNSTLGNIALTIEANDLSRFIMTIGWLLKLGICQYHPPKNKV